MRTIETQVFTFDELTDRAKEKALDSCRYLNVDHEWWESIYDDAENVGIKIKHFDTGRGWDIGIEFLSSAYESATKITKEHGDMCESHKTAKVFIREWDALVAKYSDGFNTSVVCYENEYEFDQEADELESEFVKSIGHDYLTMLRNEEEYLSSDESVKECIESNGYEFTEEGVLV
jgi:hypothetical protein